VGKLAYQLKYWQGKWRDINLRNWTLDIESEVILIELEKTDDKLETTINGVRHIQILPSSLAKDLIENDFSQMTGDFEIAKRLLEYCINDA
jgi:hypothetical protein